LNMQKLNSPVKYQVRELFKVKTSQGEIELQVGQVITTSPDRAITLLNEGKIAPIGEIAYKVYSELLGAYLWLVDTDEDRQALRSQGVEEAIYSHPEITEVRKLSPDALKNIHRIKEVFESSKGEDIVTGNCGGSAL
jgi:hypothetical protein